MKAIIDGILPKATLWAEINCTHCLEFAARNQGAVGRKRVVQDNRMVVRLVSCQVGTRHKPEISTASYCSKDVQLL